MARFTKNLTIRVLSKDFEVLLVLAQKRQTSIGQLARQAIAEFLTKQNKLSINSDCEA